MKNKLKLVLSFYYISTLVFTFIDIDNFVKNIIFLLFLFSFFIINMTLERKKEDDRPKRGIIKIIFLLFAAILVLSLLVLIVTEKTFLIPDNIITIGMIIVSILTAYYTQNYFGEKNIKYIVAALVAGYAINLLVYWFSSITGITGLDLVGYPIGQTLELHETAFIVGVIIVFFLAEKHYDVWLLLLLGIFVLDLKRISLIAIGIVVFILLLDKYLLKKKETTVLVTKVATYLFIAAYLILMVFFTEQTFNFINNLGINMSWRDHFYSLILTEKSQFAPFLGTGLRSTDYMLSLSARWNNVSAMHSDILRLYIENGIIITVAYFFVFISFISRKIKKYCGINSQLIYNLLILFTFICYSTDNLFTYYRYIFVLFVLIFSLFHKKKDRKEK